MAKYNALVSQREEDVYMSQANKNMAQQSQVLTAGFQSDATSLTMQAESARNAQGAVDDIRLKGRMTVEKLQAEASSLRNSAAGLTNSTNRSLKMVGSILGGAA